MTGKSAGVLVAVLMSVLFVLANASAAAEGQKIRIGISSKSLGFLPTIVAEKKGFYKKYDLESEHIHISLAPAANLRRRQTATTPGLKVFRCRSSD